MLDMGIRLKEDINDIESALVYLSNSNLYDNACFDQLSESEDGYVEDKYDEWDEDMIDSNIQLDIEDYDEDEIEDELEDNWIETDIECNVSEDILEDNVDLNSTDKYTTNDIEDITSSLGDNNNKEDINKELAEKEIIIQQLREELQKQKEIEQRKITEEIEKIKAETLKKEKLAEDERKKRIEVEKKLKRLQQLKEQKMKEIQDRRRENNSKKKNSTVVVNINKEKDKKEQEPTNDNIIDYDSMEIEALYKEVKKYMVKNGAVTKPMDKNEVTKVFGADNIKRLHRRGYLVMVGRNITCGKD